MDPSVQMGDPVEEEDEESLGSEVETSMSRDERFTAFIETFTSNIEPLHSLFEKLPSSVGSTISKQNRINKNYESSTLAYSEVDFEVFGLFLFDIFKSLDLDTNDEQLTFVDIGCGTGKVVFSAYMMNIFKRCAGIEILADLHKSCLTTLRTYIKHYLGSINEQVNIDFILGDATYIDWSEYDVAFVYATSFDHHMMGRLTGIGNKMKSGSIFVSVSHKLPNSDVTFDLLLTTTLEVEWGTATAYVYRRNLKSPSGEAADTRARLLEILNRK